MGSEMERKSALLNRVISNDKLIFQNGSRGISGLFLAESQEDKSPREERTRIALPLHKRDGSDDEDDRSGEAPSPLSPPNEPGVSFFPDNDEGQKSGGTA